MSDTIVECWKTIAETNDVYEISNFGKVRNRITGRVRKPTVLPNGYEIVHYNLSGKREKRYVHRLVADAFCKHVNGHDIVNHIDNNKRNNKADNLEWTNQFGNVHHGMKDKRYRLNAVPVIGYKDGVQYRFSSAHYAKKWTGCDDSGILKCCKGKQHSSKGYRWSFAEV